MNGNGHGSKGLHVILQGIRLCRTWGLVTNKGKEKEREGGRRDAITNPQSTSAENSEIAKL